MAKKPNKKLTDQLRQLIDECGLTRYRIAKESGVSEATLSKFALRQRGISNQAMDAVGEFLELKIVMGRRPRKKGK